jgi:hypothetical protein
MTDPNINQLKINVKEAKEDYDTSMSMLAPGIFIIIGIFALLTGYFFLVGIGLILIGVLAALIRAIGQQHAYQRYKDAQQELESHLV